MSKISEFFGPTPTSLQGVINVSELKRVLITSAVTGLTAAAVGVVVAIQGDLSNIVGPSIMGLPLVGAAITASLTQIIEFFRRIGHGPAFLAAPKPTSPVGLTTTQIYHGEPHPGDPSFPA